MLTSIQYKQCQLLYKIKINNNYTESVGTEYNVDNDILWTMLIIRWLYTHAYKAFVYNLDHNAFK